MTQKHADISRGFQPNMAIKTTITGELSNEELDAIVAVLESPEFSEEQMEWGISQIPFVSPEAASVLLRAWFDAGRNKKEWKDNELKHWIKAYLLDIMNSRRYKKADVVTVLANDRRAKMDRIDKIANDMTRKAAMAMVLATSPDGNIEMLLDVTTGFIQLGMGGEWWNGQVKAGHNVLHHKKEHVDEAYKPVTAIIQSKGYQVVVEVSGGFGYEHIFTIGAK